jgi:hypothetical protein
VVERSAYATNPYIEQKIRIRDLKPDSPFIWNQNLAVIVNNVVLVPNIHSWRKKIRIFGPYLLKGTGITFM